MSEAATTLIKIMGALTSPKASIKFISIGTTFIGLTFFLNPLIDKHIPAEQISLITTVLSVGIGSLLGIAIWKIYSCIESAIARKEKERETIRKAEADQKQKQALSEELKEDFKYALNFLTHEQISTLWDLTTGDKKLNISDFAVSSLIEKGYILKKTRILNQSYVVTLNTEILELVVNHKNKSITETIESFYHLNGDNSEKILDLLDGEAGLDPGQIKDFYFLDGLSRYSPEIRMDKLENEAIVYFDYYMCSAFEELKNKHYLNEISIPNTIKH